MAAIQIGPFEGNLEPDTLIVAAENRLTLRLKNTGMQPCEQIEVGLRCAVIQHDTDKGWFVPQLGVQEEWHVTFDARAMTEASNTIKVPFRFRWKDATGIHHDEAAFDVNLNHPQQLLRGGEPSQVGQRSALASTRSDGKLRQNLRRLDDVQLESLCLDHFPEVGARFSEGLHRGGKMDLLLDYCRHNPAAEGRLSSLLERGEC